MSRFLTNNWWLAFSFLQAIFSRQRSRRVKIKELLLQSDQVAVVQSQNTTFVLRNGNNEGVLQEMLYSQQDGVITSVLYTRLLIHLSFSSQNYKYQAINYDKEIESKRKQDPWRSVDRMSHAPHTGWRLEASFINAWTAIHDLLATNWIT